MKAAIYVLLPALLTLTACQSEQNASVAGHFNIPNSSEAPQKKPPVDVIALMKQEQNLDDRCLKGNDNDPETWAACDKRDLLLKKIAKLGWCWGSKKVDAPADELDWLPCSENVHDGQAALGRDLGFW